MLFQKKKKKNQIFEIFTLIFFLRFAPSRPSPSSLKPTGPPLSFYIGNLKKIGFPMPTAKNGLRIVNLHPKKHRIKGSFF